MKKGERNWPPTGRTNYIRSPAGGPTAVTVALTGFMELPTPFSKNTPLSHMFRDTLYQNLTEGLTISSGHILSGSMLQSHRFLRTYSRPNSAYT